MPRHVEHLAVMLAIVLLCTSNAFATDGPGIAAPARTAMRPVSGIVSIVIDDLGNQRAEGLRAIELPGSVTYAILPHTMHGSTLAHLAHSLDKEVIVHVPMEAISGQPLGRGGLTADLTRPQFELRALAAITSVPHAQGVSNHMGSRLTTMERPMHWLMNILLARKSWMFLDSRTTADTIAEATARDVGLRTTFRDVFLDNEVSVPAIRARFQELLAKARTQGSAVAIGHPYAQTLQVLAEELPRLVSRGPGRWADKADDSSANPPARGIRLVPLSRLIARRASVTAHEIVVQSSSGHAAIIR